MSLFVRTLVAVLALVLGASPPALAQRRGGKAQVAALEVELPFAVRFGEVVVAAGRYRASASRRGLGLAHPTTMVPVATVPVQISESATNVTPPTVEVKPGSGDTLTVIVRARNRVYLAQGVKTDPPVPAKREVELAGRTDAELGDVTPEQKTELELIHHALSHRYLKDVKHCADTAHRSRWKTDDRRFWNCVCPLAERWRLPQVKEDMRVHFPLAKGKFGISITVNPKGQVSDCRVWAGREPPSDEKIRGAGGAVAAAEKAKAASTPEPPPDEAAGSSDAPGEAKP